MTRRSQEIDHHHRGARALTGLTDYRRNTIAGLLIILLILSVPSHQTRAADDPAGPADSLDYKRILPQATASLPNITHRIHNNGRFWNTVMNNGFFGNPFSLRDNLARRAAPSFYFPKYSRKRYGYRTGLWIGGIVDGDTLVSTTMDDMFTQEFFPDLYPGGDFTERSIETNSLFYDTEARGQQEYTAQYADTFENHSFVPFSSWDQRKHKSLGLVVTQTSYSWSQRYAEDFIITDYLIKNTGTDTVYSGFVGIYHNGGVNHIAELPYPRSDDVEGYIDSLPYPFEEMGNEAIQCAWVIDNDGQPTGTQFSKLSVLHGFGVAPLRTPSSANISNFNWWVSSTWVDSWGPRRQGTTLNPLRKFFGKLGVPYGDPNKYYLMSHPEVDYSGLQAGQNNTLKGWMPAHKYGGSIASGHAVNFVLSYGPFTIAPGHTVPFAMVQAIGENVHTDGRAYRRLFRTYSAGHYMAYLDFSDLIENIRWAKRIYDNPGVDTNNDGDSGRYIFHIDDITGDSTKIYFTGDGVPDLKGAQPPPAPEARVRTEKGKIYVRWNGAQAERFFDPFVSVRDFEGYRVYLGRSDNEGDLSVISSWDHENYNRHKYNTRTKEYELLELPLSLDSLRVLYGANFDPNNHPYHNPIQDDTVLYYFSKMDFNHSEFGTLRGIYKVYPDAMPDSTDLDEEGRMRYYEYEYVIEDLLPTVPYWVSITAFDFGHAEKGLEPLESSPFAHQVKAFAVDREAFLDENYKLNVYVYPNPYHVDEEYPSRGLENRFSDLSEDRARTIYFANLPPRCTISLYSIDGDFVRKLEHDVPAEDPTSSQKSFNLVTRNTQAMESGLYYWVIESEWGTQIGKFALIK